MKKIYSILALLLIVFTFGGCTLSMEEWLDEPATSEVPEEKRGVDAPYTETIPDVITVTYKYNPGVRPVTTKHRGYLAHIEADTIIYFYDNMPKDLLPLEGEYLAAGVTPQFPTGLNHRVLAVSHEGGLYKVVTTFATMNEVYDDLIYELDLAYVPPLNDYIEEDTVAELEYSNGTEEKTNATKKNKVVVTDWSIYNKVKGLTEEDIKFIKRANTRSIIHSEPKIITRGTTDNNSTIDSVSYGFTFRTDLNLDDNAGTNKINWFKRIYGKELIEAVNNKKKFLPNNSSVYLEMSYCNKTIVRGYSMVDKDKEYDKTYTETTEKLKYGLAMGIDLGQRFSLGSEAEDGNIAKSAWKKANEKFKFEKLRELIKLNKNCPETDSDRKRVKDIEIPIKIPAGVPVEMVVKFGIDLEFKFNGNVAIYKESGSIRREGYEYTKGKKTKIQGGGPTLTDYSFTGSGSASFSIIPNASVGVRFVAASDKVGALGFDIGVDGTIKLIDLKAEIGTTDNLEGPIYTNCTLSSSCTLNPYINFYAELFGWNLWSNKLSFDMNWVLWSTSTQVHPTVVILEVPGSLSYKYDGTPCIEYAYAIHDIGCGFGNGDCLPTLALFKNDIRSYNLIAYLAPNDIPEDESIKKGGVYSFYFPFDDEEEKFDPNNKYIGVPALYSKNTDSYIYYTNCGYVFTNPDPHINTISAEQLCAMDVTDDPKFNDYTGMIKYQFKVEFEANNVKAANDYGLIVDIPCLNISGYKISLKNYNIYNNYANKVSVTFYTDYAADDGMMEIYTSTYMVDKNYKEKFGSIKRIDVEYPMEYQSDRDDSRIQTSIE